MCGIPTPLELFDEIKGKVVWLVGISAIISQITTFPEKMCPALEPRTQRTRCPGRIPKPQKRGKCSETWIIWVSWPHLQIYKTGKYTALLTELLTCSGGGKWIELAITHHLPHAGGSRRVFLGALFVIPLNRTLRLQKRKLTFKEESNVIMWKKRKMVGLVNFLWMTENMKWFQR